MWDYKYIAGKKESEFNVLTADIILQHCPGIMKSLELGSGKGELTKLLKDRIPELRGSMVDNSKSACKYMQEYFHDAGYEFNIIEADIDQFAKQLPNKYDLVMSSGLIEHFQGDELKRMVQIHKDFSRKYIAICVPNATEKEIEYAKSSHCKKRYGFQRPFTNTELNDIVVDDDFRLIYNEVFYTDYKLLICIYQRLKWR